MTSPTKNQTKSKDNSDIAELQKLNIELYQNIQKCLEYVSTVDIKALINNPENIKIIFSTKRVVEEIDKFALTPITEELKTALLERQTELVFHYNRLVKQIKIQPHSVVIAFLNQGFSVDLMQLVTLTPRKMARLQARERSASNDSALMQHSQDYLPHHKSSIAKRLDFGPKEKQEPKIVLDGADFSSKNGLKSGF
jgi:hypothetical protein